uniref:NADH dehydrogenase subunit 6 n=1 Tax=Dracogyra subfusca TaxID=2038759 RepID=UPI0021D53170|nr:NADH dehydrogenase subunit 6 [Dracogyra subfuscus]UXG19107.1 NADH dehydrogenase subunit 6 [Dracogyra subfuscus]
MTSYILFSLALSLFFIMPTMTHPLSLGLCILFCSLMSCLLIGVLSYTWFGFILFLIFVGGLLVMFAYVSALSPNVYFSGKNLTPMFLILWTITGISFFSLFFSDTAFINTMLETSFTVSNSSMGEKLVIPSRISIMVGLGIILLLNLLAVVKICYYQQGPLRQHFI